MTNETAILQECRLAASEVGAIVWRNNTGALKDRSGRLIRYGLCTGSSDLIGMFQGRFLAIEIKKPKKNPTPEQHNFMTVVNNNGGIAFVARSPEDVLKLADYNKNAIILPEKQVHLCAKCLQLFERG